MACVGLVDPILPAISHELNASPSEVTLLFTSYLVVTAVAMLITNWVMLGTQRVARTRLTLALSIAAVRVRRPRERKETAMRYLMLVCRDPAIELTPEDRAAMRDSVVAWVDEMESRGILLPGGHELRPASYGRTVRVRDGEALISDGPFAETKEQIGGFDVLECASLDEAIEVAGKHPVARFGAIDVRPFWPE